MICSKCNSEIPDGAKFCTVCGTVCEQKSFCTKCGQELAPGAKFCPGCGAENAPAAVSLNKDPTANDLVAKMNAAASVPTPTPAASVPTPTPTPTPTPANGFSGAPASGFNSGFTAPSAPGMSPMGDSYNGLSGAAAVVAAPAKKKVGAGKIVLIIAIVLAVLIGGAAAFFFTNKATALSLVMGKPKYAAMIEKGSLKKVTDSIDMDVVSEQIKSASGTMSMFLSLNSTSIDDVFDLSNNVYAEDPEIAKLMSVSPVLNEGVDIKTLLKSYNEFMQSVYGANRLSGSMSMKLTLGDELMYGGMEDILNIVNGAEITYDVASSEKMLGSEFGIKFNNKTVDARMILEDDGSAYILFPFASDKALKYSIPTSEGSSAASAKDAVVLELDGAEIERLVNEILDIYSEYIKQSSVTMESGSLTVAGIAIDGKQITADISGKNLENLFKDIFDHIANDQYFCGKIVDYVKNFEPDFTASDYKNGINDIVKDMRVDDNDKLIVTTIVNNSGKVLAKSYTAAEGAKEVGSIAFAENDTLGVIEIKSDGESVLTVTNTKTSENSGNITVKFGIDTNETLGINLTYSGVGTAEFGKSEVPVGTYSLSFDTSGIRSDRIDAEEMNILKSFALTFSTSVSGKTENVSFAVSVRDFIDLELKANMTLFDDVAKYSTPSNVLDLTEAINNGDIDDATMQQLSDYLEDFADALENAFAGTALEDIFTQSYDPGVFDPPIYDEPHFPENNTSSSGNSANNIDALGDLEDKVWDEMMEVWDWFDYYDFDGDYENDPAFINAMDYQDRLSELDDRLWDVQNDGCTDAELEAFNKEFEKIIAQKDQIRSAVINSGNSGMSAA